MKEMEYKEIMDEVVLLYNSIYKGYHYYILSYGTHPCAYVEIPKRNKLYNLGYIEIEDNYNIKVHGGFTYAREKLRISDSTVMDNSWFLGWDYAHISDYQGYFGKHDFLNEGCKKWTTSEIDFECRNVIDQLVLYE